MNATTKKDFLDGMRDGIPIALGYFAVSFSLGITACNAGITALQGFFMSLLNNASAGEYAGISAIASKATYLELALLILVANARYLLMSCALSQKLSTTLPLKHRFFIGFGITDEIFGISVAHVYPTPPSYIYGAFAVALPSWATGTALGVIAGNILPAIVVNALSVAIYGMFIAIIIPPCKTNKTVMIVVLISFVASSLFTIIPGIKEISESLRIILITLIITTLAALIWPIKD